MDGCVAHGTGRDLSGGHQQEGEAVARHLRFAKEVAKHGLGGAHHCRSGVSRLVHRVAIPSMEVQHHPQTATQHQVGEHQELPIARHTQIGRLHHLPAQPDTSAGHPAGALRGHHVHVLVLP